MEIDPNVKVFIAALRRGRDYRDAFEEYCWAKLALPIDCQDLQRIGDPFLCQPRLDLSLAPAMGADAFAGGKSDEEIASAFERGQFNDGGGERVVWRAMKDEERPTHGQLLRAMDRDSLMKAGELLGYATVARAYVTR